MKIVECEKQKCLWDFDIYEQIFWASSLESIYTPEEKVLKQQDIFSFAF